MNIPLLPFPVRPAQFALQDLSGAALGEGSGGEFDAPGALVGGDETPAVGDQLFLAQRLALLAAQDRMDLLPPFLVRDADDGTLRHGFVLADRVFDLSRVDVFPTTD
jgi:hypothetical protein